MFSRFGFAASLASVTLVTAGIQGADCSSALSRANFWFAFGDSYTTRGFNASSTVPAPGNPLGNPAYPGKTTTGGTNYVDVLTAQLNGSLVLTYDYAVGGAPINATLVPPAHATRSLVRQTNDFLQRAGRRPESAPWTGENALFSIWIGINDIGGSYTWPGDRKAFNDRLMDAYFEQVHRLYEAGARNFLFINVPPMERTPLMLEKTASARALYKSLIIDYNLKLVDRIGAFKAKYPGMTTWVWHSNGAFLTILDNYKKYGFTNVTSWGGAGDFWGNNYHPSSKVHTFLAKDIAEVMKGTRWFS